jgi:tetratricopeptide (TPR) repeat protein
MMNRLRSKGVKRIPVCLVLLFSFTAMLLLTPFPLRGQESLPGLIKKVEPSVVAILTYNKEGKVIGQGSGFFISKSGDVVTSHHVLQGASNAEIKTSREEIYKVNRVLAEDKVWDLIRLSVDIPQEAVQPVSISTTFPEVGEKVFIIGTPFGLEKTVSDGIVSAIREIPDLGKIVQVTAPISPGSSGSPVFNMTGEVIGVATFFVIAGQNLNFAIPGSRIDKLISGGGQTLSEREEVRIEDWLASSEGLYATGLRLLLVEDYERALPFFLETVKKDPRHADAHFQVAYSKGKLGRYKEAIESYQLAIRAKPDDPEIHNNLCVAYGMVGRHLEAVESCKKAITLKPDLAEGHNNLGWSFYKLGRYQEAIESCKDAIRHNPDFAMAHYNLGNAYAAQEKYPEAIESYKQALRLKFDYAEGHLNLGAAYFRMERYEEAIESYKQAIRVKPKLAEAHLDLGMSYLKAGDRNSALEEYKTLKELDKELANRLFNLIYE